MAPETMVTELQRMWDRNPEYVADGFLDFVNYFVDVNDTSQTGCIFDEDGKAYPIVDYVISKLNLLRE